jgi:phosphoglycolate phosphatase
VSDVSRRPLLVLWDIDHTLIETRGFGRELYRRAFEEATGRKLERPAEVTGRTELAIFAETLKLHDIPPSPELQQRYVDALARQYRENIDELRERGRALPGAAESLALLAEQPWIVQSVLTGNLRQVAITKLEAFDLARYIDFDIGAYGDDNADRWRLVAVAQGRASGQINHGFDYANTVLIGDSSQDVVAGRDGGAFVIAVASGSESVAALRHAGATRTVDTLNNATDTVITFNIS